MGIPQTTPLYIDQHEGYAVWNETKGVIFMEGEAPQNHVENSYTSVTSEAIRSLVSYFRKYVLIQAEPTRMQTKWEVKYYE